MERSQVHTGGGRAHFMGRRGDKTFSKENTSHEYLVPSQTWQLKFHRNHGWISDSFISVSKIQIKMIAI